jgi:hypothetical protein
MAMAILERRKAVPPEVHCIREVRVPISLERQAETTYFYSTLLGLPPWPRRYQIPGGVGFGNPRCGLYLQFRHDAEVDPMRRRFTLVTASLDEVQQRLEEEGWPSTRRRGLDVTDEWLLVTDPIGHIIIIRPLRNVL